MERDSTTGSLLATAGAAWHLMALLASDRSLGNERSRASTTPRSTCANTPTNASPSQNSPPWSASSESHFAALFKPAVRVSGAAVPETSCG